MSYFAAMTTPGRPGAIVKHDFIDAVENEREWRELVMQHVSLAASGQTDWVLYSRILELEKYVAYLTPDLFT
jgi:hypothetical protein